MRRYGYDRRELAAALYDPSYRGAFEHTSGAIFAADEPSDIARIRSLYDGEVRYADHLFETFRRGLSDLDLFDETLIVLTADHGEEFMERGSFHHEHLYEETIRIPLVLRHPAAATGSRSGRLASNVDLLPTLAGILGAEAPPGLDGRDLRHDRPDGVTFSFAMTGARYRAISVRGTRHKLILECSPERRLRLFDLVSDPGETRPLPLAGRSQEDDLGGYLGAVLPGDPCQQLHLATAGQDPIAGLPEETIRALEALGYMAD